MPTPDPDGLSVEYFEDGRFTVSAEVWPHGNRRHRIARMKGVLRNLSWGGWTCWECREPIPLFRRADARYCGESCRKRAARARRIS
tara:strand:- start:6122 stop:6379 length:258 start_codon:yes stop_codon:yes gene_type:complete